MHTENKLGVFNLLFPKKTETSESVMTMEIEDLHFTLERQSIPISDKKDSYICISYSWNSERVPHPFHKGYDMSGRTLPVLKTAIRALKKHKDSLLKTESDPSIWIDSFCIPSSGIEREPCLRSIGTIYGNALYVLVVLSPSSSTILKEVREKDKIETETIHLLEQDDWAMRAWTYQEIVNSRTTYFIAEGEFEAPVRGDYFFDAFVKAKDKLREKEGYDFVKMNAVYPALGNFESVILDWRMGGYQERSAYQVMSSIEVRKAAHPNDLIYAMIGAIKDKPSDNKNILPTSPEEYFIHVCESKKDFSFIYTTGERSTLKGQCWRPVAGQLQVVLPRISCTGEGQPGVLYPTHLQLDDVCVCAPEKTLKEKVEGWVKFYNIGDGIAPVNKWPHLIVAWLKRSGFTGCGQCIELETGYFFPLKPILNPKDMYVIITTGVTFPFGAPAIIVEGNDTDVYSYSGVGVFFGRLSSKNKSSINVG